MTAIDKVQYLQIGVQGENIAMNLEFDMTAWAGQYPDATFHILFKPYNETEVAPQASSYDSETKVLTWTVGAGATAIVGVGYTEIRAQDGEGLIKKTRVIPTAVENSVSGVEVNPPAAYADWVAQVLNAGAAVIAAAHGTEVSFSIGTNGHLIFSYTDEDSETITVDLGPVDAYGMAVEAGYQRTRTQFEDELANTKNYCDAAEAARYEAQLAQAAAELAKTYAQLFTGAPRTAATAAAMEDTDKIYVYTGSTGGGLKNGHWYYHNGTAWTDGGAYNSTALTTDTTLAVSGAAADAKVTGDKLAEQKSAFTESIKSTAENVISVSDFTETSGSPTKPTISVDTVNNELTITQASNGTYCAGQTVDTFVANNLINGRTYRLHAKATFLSGTPTVYLAVRGISGNVNAVAASVEIKGGQDNFVEFIADQYMKRISLFVTWETAKTASVKFGDIWLEEYNTAGIDYKSRAYIEKTNEALQRPWERNIWYERSDGSAVTGLETDLYVSTPVSDYLTFPFGAVISPKAGYRINAYCYERDTYHTFVSATNWINAGDYYECYYNYDYKIVIAKANATKTTLDDIVNLNIVETVGASLLSNNIGLPSANQYSWEQNIWYERSDGSAVTGLTSDLYVSTPVSDYIDFQFGACVTVKSGYRFNAYRYTKDSEHTFVDATAWVSNSGYYQAYPEYSYKFVLAKANNTKISNINEVSNLILAQTKDYFLHRSIVEKYEPEINDTVSRALSDKDANTITFCLMTDSHNRSDISTVEHCNIIAAMADRTASVFLAHLGDVIEGYGASKQINKSYLIPMWENLHKSNRPALYAIAHHELYGSGGYQQYLNDPTAITPSEAIGIWGKDARWLGAVFSADQQNYYFDYSGVRFIFINGCSTSSTIGFSDDVISFVQTALENCTLPVIVFSHVTANKYTNISDAEPTNAQTLETILHDYGNVIAYFHGHVHWDNIAVPNGIGYPYYSVCSSLPIKTTATCTLNTNLHAWDREIGTITEFCIDIVNIHKDTGVIKSFRFGAGEDREYVPE